MCARQTRRTRLPGVVSGVRLRGQSGSPANQAKAQSGRIPAIVDKASTGQGCSRPRARSIVIR